MHLEKVQKKHMDILTVSFEGIGDLSQIIQGYG